ncbi:unnamed protein product [Rangifer tarandus platyrhynchus]|uniref:Uncharacterized protein n=2 Tax=Rangifer tarandus platyrhynchus TaxID=3082113 RepID=A0ABN8ZWE0_RANTA|nr:unnamed protein product [Rangifer tarandus platyrhynchus]
MEVPSPSSPRAPGRKKDDQCRCHSADGLCEDWRVLLSPWARKDSERYLPPVLQRAHGSGTCDRVRQVLVTSLGVPDAHWSRLDGAGVSGVKGTPAPEVFLGSGAALSCQ